MDLLLGESDVHHDNDRAGRSGGVQAALVRCGICNGYTKQRSDKSRDTKEGKRRAFYIPKHEARTDAHREQYL